VARPPQARIAIDPDSGALVALPRLPVGEDPGPNGASGDVRPSAVHVLAPASHGQTEVRPVSRAYAIKKLADQDVVNLEAMGARALEALARFTAGLPCYELAYVGPKDVLDGLQTALEQRPTEVVATSGK
jgi:hypothetical protein